MPRREKKFHFIYKTTNNITGKYYYGMHSTNNLDDGYLGSGKRLRYSINKYGEENHTREILEFFDNREDLANREAEIVDLNEIAKEDCMNIQPGGGGGFTKDQSRKGALVMNEVLKNDKGFQERRKKRGNELFKRLHSEGKIKYLDWTGRRHSEESKRKMSKSSNNKGSNNSQFGTCWITKNGDSKRIKKEELQSYLDEGWNKGAKFNRKKERRCD